MATESGTTRRIRERELVLATRALFDERGMQHAPIEEVAKSVGIARGLIYRIFSSKEELYVLTVTDYLDELLVSLTAAVAGDRSPEVRLQAVTEAFASFCLRYPAFLDCAISLMQRPAGELQQVISDSVWVRLGQGMARALDAVAQVVRDGNAAGDWDVEDPDFAANALWTQGIGLMHLARIGVGVRETVPGLPELFAIDADRVVAACVTGALALMGPRPA